MQSQTVVISLDNVICTDNEDIERCVPKEHVVLALNKIKAKNNFIIITTGRDIKHAGFTIQWLNYHNIPYDHIQFGKPKAKIYIDDKAYKFKDWGKFLKEVYNQEINCYADEPIKVYERALIENLKLSLFDTDNKAMSRLNAAMRQARKVACL